MPVPLAFLKIVGKGVLNAFGGGVAGDLLLEVLPEAVRGVCGWYAENREQKQLREDVRAMLQAQGDELKVAVRQIVEEIAGDKPSTEQQALQLYLSLIPGAMRQSLRRPSDPEGAKAAELIDFSDPDQVLPLLPARLPRFRPGDRPLPGIDWELVELLGVGGFGEVWKARNPHFDAVPPVALKFCLDPAAKDRLLRHEAAVLNQVMRQGRHPGVVTLQHTYLSADPPCLEYEYVSGGDLTGLLSEWRGVPQGAERALRAARVVRDLAQVVGFAHRQSPPVVHRDLKPANILIPARNSELGTRSKEEPGITPSSSSEFRVPSSDFKIADFGIGGLAANQALARTAHNVSQGAFLVTALRGAHTPLYASPQQMRGNPPDPRDDVFSLGVIWYQLLTGNLTAGRPGGSRWVQRLTEQGVPAGHLHLLGECVEEDPADRPRDGADLAERLTKLVHPAPAVKPPPPLVAPELPRELTVSCGIRLVLIPAGTFLMGAPPGEHQAGEDEQPQRRVTISRPFYMSVTPVTQQQYEAVVGSNPSRFTRAAGGGPLHPVEQVSWEDAVAYCRRLSQLPAERRAGHVFTLPTEAQWEYACRAGRGTAFALGDSLSAGQANFDGTRPYGAGKEGAYPQRTTKVGSYPANAWGLLDMHGNVWEWCADWYDEGSYAAGPAVDPAGPERGTARVLRGGSWNNSGHVCRAAKRNRYRPDFKNDNIGFRLVLVPR